PAAPGNSGPGWLARLGAWLRELPGKARRAGGAAPSPHPGPVARLGAALLAALAPRQAPPPPGPTPLPARQAPRPARPPRGGPRRPRRRRRPGRAGPLTPTRPEPGRREADPRDVLRER